MVQWHAGNRPFPERLRERSGKSAQSHCYSWPGSGGGENPQQPVSLEGNSFPFLRRCQPRSLRLTDGRNHRPARRRAFAPALSRWFARYRSVWTVGENPRILGISPVTPEAGSPGNHRSDRGGKLPPSPSGRTIRSSQQWRVSSFRRSTARTRMRPSPGLPSADSTPPASPNRSPRCASFPSPFETQTS